MPELQKPVSKLGGKVEDILVISGWMRAKNISCKRRVAS